MGHIHALFVHIIGHLVVDDLEKYIMPIFMHKGIFNFCMRFCLFNTLSFTKVDGLPHFGNLNQLKLVLYDCNYWEFLAEFLNSAPNLEGLDLEDVSTICVHLYYIIPPCVLKLILINQFFFHRQRAESDEEELSELQWNPPTVVPSYLSSLTPQDYLHKEIQGMAS